MRVSADGQRSPAGDIPWLSAALEATLRSREPIIAATAADDPEAQWLLGQSAALILDLDGTLASAGLRRQLRLWREIGAEGRVLAHLGAAMAAARGRRHLDLDGFLAATMARRALVPPHRARRALAAVVDGAWPRAFAGASVPPGLMRLLRAADRRGLVRAVWSDHPAIDKLAAMGLGGWSVICAARPVGALKPLPDAGWGLLAQLGVPPSRALLIGDRDDTDGAAAAALGCRFVRADAVEAVLAPSRLRGLASRLV